MTVGALTELAVIKTDAYDGWKAIAMPGTGSTSARWQNSAA